MKTDGLLNHGAAVPSALAPPLQQLAELGPALPALILLPLVLRVLPVGSASAIAIAGPLPVAAGAQQLAAAAKVRQLHLCNTPRRTVTTSAKQRAERYQGRQRTSSLMPSRPQM